MKDNQFQVQSNKIGCQRIRASYGPQENGISAGSYSPAFKGWGYDGDLSNLHTYYALIAVSQTFISKGNINNQYLSIQMLNLGLQNQGKISEQYLKKSITQQYITAYDDLLQINFNQEIIAILKKEEISLKN